MGSTAPLVSHKQINARDAIFSLGPNIAAHATYNFGSAEESQGVFKVFILKMCKLDLSYISQELFC